MNPPSTPIFQRIKARNISILDISPKASPSHAKKNIEIGLITDDKEAVKNLCKDLDLFVKRQSYNRKIDENSIKKISKDVLKLKALLKEEKAGFETQTISLLKMENEDLRSYILNSVDFDNESYLEKFKNYADADNKLLSFRMHIEKSISKWIDAAEKFFHDEEIEYVMKDFFHKISKNQYIDFQDLLNYSDGEEKSTCNRCINLQAELDHLEMKKINEEEKIKELEKHLGQIKAELEEQQKRVNGNGSENLFKTYLLLIRTDIENLLGCDLPEIDNGSENSLSRLWIHIRKIIGDTAKKSRIKAKKLKLAEENSTNLTVSDLKSIISQLKSILVESYENSSKIHNIQIGSYPLYFSIEKDQEEWNNKNLNDTVVIKSFGESVNEIEFNGIDENPMKWDVSDTDEYNPYREPAKEFFDRYESITEHLAREDSSSSNLSKVATYLENPLIAELQETIKLHQEKEKNFVHEKEYLTNSQHIINKKYNVCKNENKMLLKENEDLKENLKYIHKVMKGKTQYGKENAKNEENVLTKINLSNKKKSLEDQQIEALRLELKQKEKDLERCENTKLSSQISRSILNIRTQISKLKTEKLISDNTKSAQKLNKSFNKFEKEWLINEEKKKIELERSRTPKPAHHSQAYWIKSPRSSISPSPTLSPLPDPSNLSFKSIASIYQQKSLDYWSTEEKSYLKKECDRVWEQKSYLEEELRRIKDETHFDEKINSLRAQEEAAKKIIEIKEHEEKILKEKTLGIAKKERELDEEKKQLIKERAKIEEEKEKIEQREENIKKVEYSIKLKERMINRKVRERIGSNEKQDDYIKQYINKLEKEKKEVEEAFRALKEESDSIILKKQELEKEIANFEMKKLEIADACNKINAITQKYSIE